MGSGILTTPGLLYRREPVSLGGLTFQTYRHGRGVINDGELRVADRRTVCP